jgi:5'-deoxynucleotidase YfbR-like HD superfamily hydrolase
VTRPRIPGHEDAPEASARMHSGRWVNLYDPSPLDIELADWVRGCSRVDRWGGQSIPEHGWNDLCHMMLVERILVNRVWPKAPREARLWALMHDLHEGGGLGDIATPYGRVLKAAGLDELKQRLDRALRLAAGLSASPDAETVAMIKRADQIAAVTEGVRLAGWPETVARSRIGRGYDGPLWRGPLQPLDQAQARLAWTKRFLLLGGRGLAMPA